MEKHVKRVGFGGYECEACGYWAETMKEILDHLESCEYIGYLLDHHSTGKAN